MASDQEQCSPQVPHSRVAGEAVAIAASTVCALVLLAVLAAPAFTGKVYTYDDLGNLHLPQRHFYADCLEEGYRFEWHPGLYCGFYVHGEGQAGMYHPLRFLIYRVLPLETGFTLELLLSYPIALTGMYLLLKWWRLCRAAALFGGIAFAFSPYLMLHFMHMQMVAVAVHLPWLLYFQSLMGRPGRRLWPAFAVMMLTASQVLLGHPQLLAMSIFIEGLYALFLKGGLPQLATLAGAKIIGALIGAVQILPTFDALLDSGRLDAVSYAPGMYSLEKANLLQLVAPYLFEGRVVATIGELNTQEYGSYVGAGVLVLALTCLVARRGPQRRLALAGLALAGLGFLLAFGEHGPLFALLQKVPLMSLFRAPARFLFFVNVGLIVAASVTLDALMRPSTRARMLSWRLLLPACAAAVAAVLIALVSWGLPDEMLSGSLLARLAGPVLFVPAAALLVAAGRRWPQALVVLIVFTAGDLAVYGLSFVRSEPAQHIEELADGIDLDVDPVRYRLHVVPSYTNAPAVAGYRLSSGVSSLPPRTRLDRNTIAALRVSAVMYLVADTERIDGGGEPRWDVRRVPAPLPRARLVSQVITTDDLSTALEDIDPQLVAFTDEPVSIAPGEPGLARIVKDEPGDVKIATAAPSRQLLVFAERFHKGWRASTDGQDLEIIRVYGDFMGCLVEPGEQLIHFEFHPESLRIGKGVSVAALAAAMLAAVAHLLRTCGKIENARK